MAFDSVPGGDPRGPTCPKCGGLIRAGEPTTKMHFAEDPYGHLGMSGRPWHSACAQPHWDSAARALDALRKLGWA
jgi:hypothetical protein